VRFADLELRDAIGTVQQEPTPVDFFDCLSYYKTEHIPYTGRAQSVNLDGRVSAEGFFQEGRPEGLWTRWHDNGQKREEFFITEGECARAQHCPTLGQRRRADLKIRVTIRLAATPRAPILPAHVQSQSR